MNIKEQFEAGWVFFDGGTGTILQEQGLQPGELPEFWNLTHPDVIKNLQKEYLLAGADIINTNTFGANALKFERTGEASLEQIVTSACRIAREAREESGRTDARIALDIGPSGKLLKPMGDLDFEDAVSLFSEVVKLGVSEGVDLILIETMSDLYEAKAAVLAAKECSSLPVVVTVIFGEDQKMLTGADPDTFVSVMEGLGVDALGINCGLGPVQMLPIVQRLTEVSSTPIVVNPNAGLPRSEGGKTVFDVGPEKFAQVMKEIAALGIQGLGGCCGTTPEHIRQMIEAVLDVPFSACSEKQYSTVSSYVHTVSFGTEPVIVGERINPTGKSKFKQALRDNNMDYILNEGLNQEANGAHILDVNVGLPEINEPELMEQVVRELQAVTALPLQIDTTSREAMERGMRIYNGKPMVNSVNGKEESMEMVFPLVKKYGGMVVALTLDEDGIPETAEKRVAIAEKIYKKAASYGIQKKNIIVDCLTMTVSADPQAANVTLEAVKRIHEMGGRTILGVSNVSFGLPKREVLNSAFYSLAMQNGLSAGIINPNSEAMRKAYYSYRVLVGLDENFAEYIEQFKDSEPEKMERKKTAVADASGKAETSLEDCIIKGLRERASAVTVELLKEKESLAIINENLVPALDVVGKGFEKGTMFLPQLLMSAEAAKAAFEVIRETMTKQGHDEKKKGKMILATVKGDIHDIGKNIVKVLLQNYNYDVIDLGKDVDPELVVETALKEQVSLIGLSALMTTTVTNMEETIRLIREKKPDARVVVGGAVLTQEYADMIGADYYSKDAMGTVHYAEQFFSSEKNK